MSHGIAGILFDIGGVLVELDGVPSVAAMMGIPEDHEAIHALWMASPAVIAHETGAIGEAEFATGVVADLKLRTTPESFLREFRSWPKGPRLGALELLDEIPRGLYAVAALSNTSAAHWETIGAMGVADRFDHLYLSHEIGHLKPSAAAYLTALQGMGLLPSEVLFLDDGPRNVEAAQALGMTACLARGPEEARAALTRYGVLRAPGVMPAATPL
jgi:glucose-1-phosphatase